MDDVLTRKQLTEAKHMLAVANGRKGGRVMSPEKLAAILENAKKARIARHAKAKKSKRK
jgi:hypothetical protein